MTQDPGTTPGDGPLVGDPDGIRIDDGEEFDYVLSRPDGGEFGFDAVDVPELREMFGEMQGDG